MSGQDPYVGEIALFGFNFPPRGWASCQGQLMPISQNTALFSLLGTYYGGDGRTTFALPNLQSRVPLHHGQGAGLSDYFLGQASGVDSVTLLVNELPAHTHTLRGLDAVAVTDAPGGRRLARSEGPMYSATAYSGMPTNSTAIAGGGQPHENRMPYLTINYCIALQGVFPPRS